MALETKTAPSGGIDLNGVAGLAGLFLGKSATQNSSGGTTTKNSGGTTNTGTVTQSESVSPEAVTAIVNSILSGTQGLASVAAGQNKAGLYNSSTNRLLINDLIARAGAEGAKLNKTSTQTVNTQQADNRSVDTTTNQAQTNKTAPQIKPSTAAAGVTLLQAINGLGGIGGLKKLVFGNVKGASAAPGGASNSAVSGNPAQDQATSAFNADRDSSVTNTPVTANIAQPSQTAAAGFNSPNVSEAVSNTATATGVSQATGSDIDFGTNAPVIDTSNVISTDQVDDAIPEAISGAADAGAGNIDLGGFDPSAAVDATDLNFDFQGFNDAFGDFDLGFAEGGMVDKAKMALRGRPDAEAAFNSGGDEPESKKVAAKESPADEKKEAKSDKPSYGSGNLGAKVLNYIKGYAAGGQIKGVKDTDTYSSRGPLMMASGGMVDLTNLGLRKKEGATSSPLGVISNTQSVTDVTPKSELSTTQSTTPAVSVKSQEGSDKGTGSTNTAGLNTRSLNGNPVAMVRPIRSVTDTSRNDSGDAISVPSVVGTPEENQAAMLGMVTMGLSQIGIPSVVSNTIASSLGLNVTSMNPVSQLANFVVNTLSGLTSGSDQGVTQSADAVNGMSAPSVSVDDGLGGTVSTIGASTTQAAIDAATPSVASITADSSVDGGIGDTGNDGGNDGVGGGGGPASSSAGDSSGPSYSSGGDVNGKGTETSDSILAYLSDGEFVLNATAVDAVKKSMGDDWLDELNNHFKPSEGKLQEGKKIHKAQIARRVS